MKPIPHGPITDEMVRQYRDEGYFVLDRVIDDETLAALRDACGSMIDAMHREMDRLGSDTIGINHRNKRYFIANRHTESPALVRFLFSDLMAEICRATLGAEAYLFFEQYVVKAAEVGMKFGWHQDSGYVGHPHPPYLTCWCTLDDVDEANGTVYILPYSRAGVRERVEHSAEPETNDLIGYHGDDPGIPIIAGAGSIAVFSSVTFHRSGPNTSDRMRRVYLAQYSPQPILTAEGDRPWALATPFLREGERVAP